MTLGSSVCGETFTEVLQQTVRKAEQEGKHGFWILIV